MNALKSELAPESLKIKVVGFRQRLSQRHVRVRRNFHGSIARNQSFAQGCQSDRELYRRTGRSPFRERQILVHHRQNASIGRINRDHGAIHIAQSVNCRLTNDRIFAATDIPSGEIGHGKGISGEMLVIATMSARIAHSTAMPKMCDFILRFCGFAYFSCTVLGASRAGSGNLGSKCRASANRKCNDCSEISINGVLAHSNLKTGAGLLQSHKQFCSGFPLPFYLVLLALQMLRELLPDCKLIQSNLRTKVQTSST